MRRSLILSQESAQVANVGDIAYKATDGSIKVVAPDAWDASLGTPVGVVVIPSGFAPDNGLARIVSLYWGSLMGTGDTEEENIKWSNVNVDTSLTNHNMVPLTDNKGTATASYNSNGFLPSDKITGTASYVDPVAKYGATFNFSPSPYLGDAPNPAYYAPISGYNNALADFDGKGNTDVLVDLGTGYYAANAARNYKAAGAEEIEWYLPSMGELGYLIVRFNKINSSLSKVGVSLELSKFFLIWSSTENSSDKIYALGTELGLLQTFNKTTAYFVRPFAQLDF